MVRVKDAIVIQNTLAQSSKEGIIHAKFFARHEGVDCEVMTEIISCVLTKAIEHEIIVGHYCGNRLVAIRFTTIATDLLPPSVELSQGKVRLPVPVWAIRFNIP